MKIMNRKFLAAGLLAGALTFVGCKSDKSAERTGDTSQTPPAGTTDQGTTTPSTESTGTQTDPGTGGSGFNNDVNNDVNDDILNEGGNVDDTTRIPDSPADTTPDDNMTDSQIPEGTR